MAITGQSATSLEYYAPLEFSRGVDTSHMYWKGGQEQPNQYGIRPTHKAFTVTRDPARPVEAHRNSPGPEATRRIVSDPLAAEITARPGHSYLIMIHAELKMSLPEAVLAGMGGFQPAGHPTGKVAYVRSRVRVGDLVGHPDGILARERYFGETRFYDEDEIQYEEFYVYKYPKLPDTTNPLTVTLQYMTDATTAGEVTKTTNIEIDIIEL